MLRIIVELEPVEDKIAYVSDYFDDSYDASWFESDLAKEVIRGIDKSEYIDGECIKSPVLGMIPPSYLSTGCKGCLILLNQPDVIVSGERFGDNCFPWLSKIGEQMDITITMHHYLMDFDMPIRALVLNNNQVVSTAEELDAVILDLGDWDGRSED